MTTPGPADSVTKDRDHTGRPDRPRPAAALLAVLLLCAWPSTSATIEDRDIDIEIEGRSFTKQIRLTVSMDEAGDLSTWSEYSFIVDDHVRVEDCGAEILDVNGAVVHTVSDKDFRREPSVGFGLHSSADAIVVPFQGLEVGQKIRISLTRKYDPLFWADSVLLGSDVDQRSLRVRIHGGGDSFRWALQAADGVVSVEEIEGGIEIQGTDIPRITEPDYAPDAISALPLVRFAWNGNPTWRGVGGWYTNLVERRLTDSPNTAALALKVTADAITDRDRLVAIVEHVKKTIRYEAVEIGEGGWVPSPADEVVSRGWGDCKDMSHLLVEMLRAVGIPANLVLLRAGRTGQIDINFPSTLGFNHCIAAVPTEGIDVDEQDPVAHGFLFIDATMDRGDPLWLSPYNQGQWVVIAAGSESRLVQIPILVNDEQRVFVVEGTVDPTGGLTATAVLRLQGSRALSWVRDLDAEAPERIDERIRGYFQSLIPGGSLSGVSWHEIEGRVPSIHLQADVTLDGFVRGSEDRRRLRPGTLTSFPEARELEGRTVPVVLKPGHHVSLWRLRIPDDWCPPTSAEERHQNSVGRVTASSELDENSVLIVDRRVTIYRWWFGPESFDHLRELSVAENKLSRRSVRLKCPEGDS